MGVTELIVTRKAQVEGKLLERRIEMVVTSERKAQVGDEMLDCD